MTKTWKTAAGAVLGVALLAGAGAAVVTAREQGPMGPGGFGRRGPGGPGGPDGPGGILPGLRALELTDAQKQQLKATMDAHKAAFDAQREKAGAARQALHAAVTGETFDESAIRQAAAGLAVVEADGAVLRGKVHSEVWALLTPEQQTKAKALEAEMAQRATQARARAEQRRGQRAQRQQAR